MKDKIIRLFREEGLSPYAISVETGASIKEVYHHIRQHKEMKERHAKVIARQRELDARN